MTAIALAPEYLAALDLAQEQVIDAAPEMLICPKCGGERQTDRLLFCFACCVSFDDESIRIFTEARDTIARWLLEAEPLLVALFEQDDPGYPAAKVFWDMRLKNYRALVFLLGGG